MRYTAIARRRAFCFGCGAWGVVAAVSALPSALPSTEAIADAAWGESIAPRTRTLALAEIVVVMVALSKTKEPPATPWLYLL